MTTLLSLESPLLELRFADRFDAAPLQPRVRHRIDPFAPGLGPGVESLTGALRSSLESAGQRDEPCLVVAHCAAVGLGRRCAQLLQASATPVEGLWLRTPAAGDAPAVVSDCINGLLAQLDGSVGAATGPVGLRVPVAHSSSSPENWAEYNAVAGSLHGEMVDSLREGLWNRAALAGLGEAARTDLIEALIAHAWQYTAFIAVCAVSLTADPFPGERVIPRDDVEDPPIRRLRSGAR
ncbi:hypothetical protein [Cellulomonas carbonis]|uniref:hypothetical protein n=1 Tax=Cellulomonas carbonis TaxID=1386092 RepID=UPI00166DEE1B|nr:hypothetical protein [Cellulomonas carbonis]GGC17863.1 hypothetical protein GCM10010972_33870 [Cellulomonas carbonis]